MQSTSQTWHALLASGAPLQARATIGGVVYTDISAPVITRALMQDRLSVGNVVSASLALAVRGAVNIPRSAAVVVEVRLNDGQTASEWLPQGTFYISRRMRDPVTGLLALECYDALLKANAVWTPSTGTWPRTMAAVTAELAALLGVTLDSRTVIPTGAAYAMSEPAEGTTIRDVLSLIAQAAGGNWVMTPAGLLRLVRVGESGDTVDVTGVVGGIDVGQAGTVTGVRSTVDGVGTLIGDDTGIVVDVSIAPMIAAEMAEDLIGQTYAPFHLSGAIYDPAAELGDGVRAGAGGEVISALCSEQAAYGPAFRGDIAAPDPGEVTDEYPYIGSAERTLALAKAAAIEAVDQLDDELTQQEIFNRLTDDGAAQGLLLYNGQLYINASYINAGYLSANHIQGGTLTLGGQGNQNGVLQVLDASGNQIGDWTNTGINIKAGSIQLSKIEQYQSIKILLQESASEPFKIIRTDNDDQEETTTRLVGDALIIERSSGNNIILRPNDLILSDGTVWFYLSYNNGSPFMNVYGDAYISGNVRLGKPLSIDNGGTGATSAADARTNLGVTPANIGAKAVQSAVSDPTASGTAVAFIDSISQNAQGVISPTKKTVQSASQSAAGLMSAADKKKLDGIAAGAAVTSVNNQTGAVSITPANIGAVAKSGDTMTGALNTANNVWNKIGDDVQIGDINEGGTLGIQGLNGNTSIRFTTYNQTNKVTGGKISWDGANFILSNALYVPNMVVRSGSWQFYFMQDTNGAEVGHMRGDEAAHHIAFREITPGTNSAYEDYFLPNPTIQSGAAGYYILTSKSAVTIPQGGTGATTPAQARANLEVLRTGHLGLVNLDTILYNFLGTVWDVTGTGVSVFGSNCGTLICTDVASFGTSGTRLQQIFMNFFGNDIWIRKRTDTTWSEWTCLRQNNGAVPVSAGGTGATTPDGACANIGAVKKSGDTMTGPLNAANGVWNKIGDDVQIGDINEGGTLGIQGLNGNTSIRFTTYNQTNNGTGGKISWDGANFILSNALPVGSGGTGATTAAGARTNLGTSLYISSNTSATVYNQLNALNTSEDISAMLTETAAKYLSGNKVTHAVDGVIRKASATSYVFAMFDGYGYAYRWQATVTASGATVGNCFRFAGTQI